MTGVIFSCNQKTSKQFDVLFYFVSDYDNE